MAEQHDMFDDIIEISKGVDALKNPFGGITDALLGTVDESKRHWNPADYKERPRVNCIPCLACKSEKSSCHACMDVCPVNAIEIEDGAIDVLDSCPQMRPVRRRMPHRGFCEPAPAAPRRSTTPVAVPPPRMRPRMSPARAPSSASRVRMRCSWRASVT